MPGRGDDRRSMVRSRTLGPGLHALLVAEAGARAISRSRLRSFGATGSRCRRTMRSEPSSPVRPGRARAGRGHGPRAALLAHRGRRHRRLRRGAAPPPANGCPPACGPGTAYIWATSVSSSSTPIGPCSSSGRRGTRRGRLTRWTRTTPPAATVVFVGEVRAARPTAASTPGSARPKPGPRPSVSRPRPDVRR